MQTTRLIVIAVAALLCLASASKSKYRPIRGNSSASPQALYKAAVRVFNDRGYTVTEKDETAGTVATGWVTVDTAMGTNMQHRWRATIDGSALTLHIDCQFVGEFGANPCEKPERADDFAGKAARLHADIVNAAK